MDRRTKRYLQEISAKSAAGRGKQLMQDVDRYAQERETLQRIKNKSGMFNKDAKAKAAKLLENPALYKKDQVLNEQEARRREITTERMVKDGIRRGDIPKPKMDKFQADLLRKHFNK